MPKIGNGEHPQKSGVVRWWFGEETLGRRLGLGQAYSVTQPAPACGGWPGPALGATGLLKLQSRCLRVFAALAEQSQRRGNRSARTKEISETECHGGG
jgi:hypothetical protein